MYVHYLSIVAVAATFTVASALAQNAPPNLAKPNPQAAQETPKSDRRVPELQFRAWKEELAAHIEKYKHYPAGRPEGDAVIRFVLDQKGHVVSVEVARSSGNAVIDEAALAIVRRADPSHSRRSLSPPLT